MAWLGLTAGATGAGATAGAASAGAAAAAATAAEAAAATWTAASAATAATAGAPLLAGAAGAWNLGTLGSILQGVGAVGALASANNQAIGQSQASKVTAKTIKQNAAFEEAQARRRASMSMGSMVATSAASGVDVTSGSPLFMELDSARQAELDAMNIRRQGDLASQAKRFEARMARAQIPGNFLSAAARGGSILSNWASRGY